jgi:hypothetical protein
MPIPYTIREVPDNLHYSWKIMASMKSVSMRMYILKALRKQLQIDIDSFRKDQKAVSELKEKLEVL